MTFPRIVVGVTSRPSGGWDVSVRMDGASEPLVPVFGMDSVELPGEDVERAAPFVPTDRRRPSDPPDPEVDALCRGDAAAIAALVDRVNRTDVDGREGDVTTYGRWLFERLLAPAWDAITAVDEVRQRGGMELALEWRADDADLHRLVWEAMHRDAGPLAKSLRPAVAMVRLVSVDGTGDRERIAQLAPISRLVRVLFVSGAGMDDRVIRPGAMFMGLLRAFESEGRSVSAAVHNASADDLKEACIRFEPDVVHIVAHGEMGDDGAPAVRLKGEGANAGQLALALSASATGKPTVVVLSACLSGAVPSAAGTATAPLAARLVAEAGIPIVCAMAGEVSEQACRLYTRRLVAAVHDGSSIVEASADGRRAALQAQASPSSNVDWALPTVYLASCLPPAFRPVDPAATERLLGIADSLQLRQPPIFIGRSKILDIVDNDLVGSGPSRRVGVVAIQRDAPISGLGGTRLLREIGLRLLRRGHLPLLLAPYSTSPPTTLHAVLSDLVDRMLRITGHLELAPFPLSVFGADPDLPPQGQPLGRFDLVDRLAAFRSGESKLDPTRVRDRLAEDLDHLVEAAAGAGAPFGDDTQAVVLCDDFHKWVDGIDGVIKLLKEPAIGLGSHRHPAPVVMLASTAGAAGVAVKTFLEENAGMGILTPPLDPLPLDEAVLGFEWILLHPWQMDAAKRLVYTRARRASATAIEADFALLEGRPGEVEGDLYLVARTGVNHGVLVTSDDEGAWRQYVQAGR